MDWLRERLLWAAVLIPLAGRGSRPGSMPVQRFGLLVQALGEGVLGGADRA